MTREQEMRSALEAERAGYVQRGLTDRVKQVDEALARLGGKPATKRRDRRSQPKKAA